MQSLSVEYEMRDKFSCRNEVNLVLEGIIQGGSVSRVMNPETLELVPREQVICTIPH